jgi:hypothetical protein
MLATPSFARIDAVPALFSGFDLDDGEHVRTGPASPGRVQTVREMVRGLDTLTGAGQRHVMGKVVDFIVAELRGRGPAPGRRARALARTLDRIASEPARLAPAVRPFARRAEVLLALLQAETA